MNFLLFIKLLLGICIAISGFIYAKQYKKRTKMLKDLHLFVLSYIDCLQFCRQSLVDFISSKKEYGEEFSQFLQNYLVYLEDKQEMSLQVLNFNNEWKEIIFNFFRNLGKSDALTESEKCKEYKIIFERYAAECEEKQKKFAPLFSKLSIYAALLFFVLFL